MSLLAYPLLVLDLTGSPAKAGLIGTVATGTRLVSDADDGVHEAADRDLFRTRCADRWTHSHSQQHRRP